MGSLVTSSRWHGRLVLGAALSTSLLLAGSAYLYGEDPEEAGAALLAREASLISEAVVLEWQRVLDGPPPKGAEVFDWLPPRAASAEPQDLADLRQGTARVFDVLLAEARALAPTDPEGAWKFLENALSRKVGPGRRLEGHRDALRLALRLGRDDEARRHWRALFTSLRPEVAEGGVSLLLSSTLSAGPVLSPGERREAYGHLVAAWERGVLHLPLDLAPPEVLRSSPGSWTDPAPLRGAWRRRLDGLHPEAIEDPRLAVDVLHTRGAALASLFGPLELPESSVRVLRPGPGIDLVHWLEGERARGFLLASESLHTLVLERGLFSDLAGSGFVVTLAGASGDGDLPIVREATLLPGSTQSFVVRHRDPSSVVSDLAGRRRGVRLAFLGLAFFTTAAGVASHRALRRGRRLAEAKSVFVANVSHELRTPVSSLLLMAENLELGRVKDEATRRRYHRLMRREADRLRRLVEDVLDFSRLERGEAPRLARVSVQAQVLAQSLEDEARSRVTDAGGTLEVRAEDLPAECRVDPDALRRVVGNLVDNALLHSGRKDVDLSLTGDGAEGLRLSVRDHGTGIPAAARGSVFRPFERIEDPDGPPGTGLGLSIVRQIVEGHGGRIRITDPPDGVGAQFDIHLPRKNE